MKAGEILGTAKELVEGPRGVTHGDKMVNHHNIAKLWSAYLGVHLEPYQVAVLMVLLKVARTKTGTPNPDDYIDMAGYAGVAGEIAPIALENGHVVKS